jgi:hypothetical protein
LRSCGLYATGHYLKILYNRLENYRLPPLTWQLNMLTTAAVYLSAIRYQNAGVARLKFVLRTLSAGWRSAACYFNSCQGLSNLPLFSIAALDNRATNPSFGSHTAHPCACLRTTLSKLVVVGLQRRFEALLQAGAQRLNAANNDAGLIIVSRPFGSVTGGYLTRQLHCF